MHLELPDGLYAPNCVCPCTPFVYGDCNWSVRNGTLTTADEDHVQIELSLTAQFCGLFFTISLTCVLQIGVFSLKSNISKIKNKFGITCYNMSVYLLDFV